MAVDSIELTEALIHQLDTTSLLHFETSICVLHLTLAHFLCYRSGQEKVPYTSSHFAEDYIFSNF